MKAVAKFRNTKNGTNNIIIILRAIPFIIIKSLIHLNYFHLDTRFKQRSAREPRLGLPNYCEAYDEGSVNLPQGFTSIWQIVILKITLRKQNISIRTSQLSELSVVSVGMQRAAINGWHVAARNPVISYGDLRYACRKRRARTDNDGRDKTCRRMRCSEKHH